MTAPQPPDLLDPADPDWASFQSRDPDWFLAVAGDAIRKYCGWHIYPNLQITAPQLEIRSKGIIMLASRLVTDVASVTVFTKSDQPCTLDPATDYRWFPGGWIERTGLPWSGELYSGYYYGNDPYYLPIWQFGYASVTFNSGYENVPRDIKEIAYELTTTTTEVPAGNARDIQTPGFKLQLMQAYGATLNCDQRNRLANYRIGGVI